MPMKTLKQYFILSMYSQGIEQKPNIHRMKEPQKDKRTERQGESSIAPLFLSLTIIIPVQSNQTSFSRGTQYRSVIVNSSLQE